MEDFWSSDDEYLYQDQDEQSEDTFGLEEVNIVDSSAADKGSSVKVITRETLIAAQREDLCRMMDMLSISEHHARVLLIRFNWDKEKVFELFFKYGKDKLFAEAGVKLVELSNSSVSTSNLTCDICIEDKPPNQFTTMECGHCFCNECWTEHFIVNINEGQSRHIKCMAHKCNSICSDTKVRTLVSARDSQIAEKFDRVLMDSYIEDNRRVKWCPSVPHCGNAIRVEYDTFCEVECLCGFQFCFRCSSEAHSPCSCIMWERWTKNCSDESMTIKWLTVNTKLCLNCRKPVEKSGGCNHVLCVCGQAFCWLCGCATGREHTYSGIANHSCGRYEKESEKKAVHAMKDLKRYLHYYDRYKAHRDSCKLEEKLKEKLHQKVAAMEERESTVSDFSWVINGLNRLFRSRKILSYSYPFAYYMFGDDLFRNEMRRDVRQIMQNLFEDQQQQLEANVEKLSMCLEEPFDADNVEMFAQRRTQIITLSNVIDKLCRAMYDCIENELLGSLQLTIHNIAPYRSKGMDKVTELSDKNKLDAVSKDKVSAT